MMTLRTLALAAAVLASPFLVCPSAFGQAPATEGQTTPVVSGEQVLFRQRVVEASRLYKGGKTAEAITAFEILNKEDPRAPEPQTWLGFLYLQEKRPAEAIPLLEAASTTNPADLEVLNNLGNAYLATGNNDAALAKFERLAKLRPEMFEAQYNIGNIHLAKREFPQAAASFRRAAALKGDSPSVYNNLGVASNEAADPRGAAEAFRKASDLSPTSALYARNAGITLAKLKSKDAAIYLERAITNGNNEPVVRLTLGQVYTDAKQYAAAEKTYAQASKQYADDATYWYNLGVLRSRTGDQRGAVEAYKKARDLDPGDLDTRQNLGLALFKRGDYTGARTEFGEALKLDPDSRVAKRNYAAALARSGKSAEAIPVLKETVRMDPTNFAAKIDLGDALYKNGDVTGARFHYAAALKLRPRSAEALNGIGLTHLYDLRLAPAEAAFRGAIAADAKYSPAYNNLALVLEKLNRRPQAISLLERAAKIDPNNPEVKRNLRRLKADA